MRDLDLNISNFEYEDFGFEPEINSQTECPFTEGEEMEFEEGFAETYQFEGDLGEFDLEDKTGRLIHFAVCIQSMA